VQFVLSTVILWIAIYEALVVQRMVDVIHRIYHFIPNHAQGSKKKKTHPVIWDK